MTTNVDDLQPRMLAPTQVEAHVTRLKAVREGLRKFEKDDGRAAECGHILEVAINVLNSEPFPTVPVEVAEDKDDDTPETIEQVQNRERAETAANEQQADSDRPRFEVDTEPSDEPQRPTTGYGSEHGIV